jgi:arsenite methyltransferase
MKETEIKKAVREGYAKIAGEGDTCCETSRSCCTTSSSRCNNTDLTRTISRNIGYSEEELDRAPAGANMGLGCGNPTALASLKEGEVVLDLGSGGGFDCFLAANQVGEKGKVIGVDMTPEMIDKARENALRNNYKNVEFRLGEIENLPVADSYADVIISNCVINLAPDKMRVFKEAFRVLKPGGRIMVSDIVLMKELPELLGNSIQAYVGCISGAMVKLEYLETIEAAGFQDITVVDETSFPIDCIANDPTARAIMDNLDLTPEKVRELADMIRSIAVYAVKPD